MVAKPYRLAPKAEADLEQVWLYTLQNWSLAQADKYHNGIMSEIEAIAAGRRRGRPASVRAGYFKRPIGSHVIWYRDLGDRMEVIRILHAAQDAEQHLHD